MKQSVTSIIWMRPLFINATQFSEIKNNSFCHSNISELRWLVLYDHKIKKRKHVFCRLSVRRSVGPSSVCKVINLEVPIFWVPIFEEYSLIVFQHIRRKKGKASYWCFLTKERTFREYGTLAEWLRRGPAKAVGYACVSSNLTGVVTVFLMKINDFHSFFHSFFLNNTRYLLCWQSSSLLMEATEVQMKSQIMKLSRKELLCVWLNDLFLLIL